MRLGIDWGGTKLEIIALDKEQELLRERVPTPNNYQDAVKAAGQLVLDTEARLGTKGTLGIGIPGTISPKTGLVRNANSVWLNGQPLKDDLEVFLDREVRIQNDANCFAVSEAIDGAGKGHELVVGIILGTGCGSGIVLNGKPLVSGNGLVELGHIPLPWPKNDELPGLKCWCGQTNCNETWLSGTGFQQDFQRRSGQSELMRGSDIMALDNELSRAVFDDYCDRLARMLAVIVNLIDPHVIVLGGGMSRQSGLYTKVPPLMAPYIFSDSFDTPIVKPVHGDSSGVRGAAWLW